jgi:hypothetical protein
MIARRKLAPDNIINMPKRRHPKHNATSFKPGVAPNPGGRPKTSEEFKFLIKEYSVDAAHRIRWMMDHADDHKTQLQAAIYIIDRAYGKPVQANEISGPNGSPLTPPDLVFVTSIPRPPTIDGKVE